ncbi:MAG TPA: sigma 54-interacting transcriptional regulator, partial [Polyangiaceae bacterium]|nr:sigma 54-interacting transcriptional regulator [Polyangiaceae bacterium]
MALETAPVSRNPRVVVKTLAIEVIEGPDAGTRFEADSDRLTVGSARGNDLTLTDPTVSRFHLELGQSQAGVVVSDLESTNGTWFGDVRLERACVAPGTVLSVGRTRLRVLDGTDTAVEVCAQDELSGVRGTTAAMLRLMAQVDRLARTNVAVLLVGESGTGKELVTRALHDRGLRAGKPLVTVDCGALAPSLIASELFGHEKGAFTGAERQHLGAFERANGGTLFLDELGELPSELQPQLLGALERQRFLRVGGKTEIAVDVRVVSATNRDLRAEVNAGRFRLDLYYRVAIVELRLPPLRERADDIPLLVAHFLREAGHAGRIEEVVPVEIMDALKFYRWPGNVRELRNWVEATLAMGESPKPWGDEPSKDSGVVDSLLDLP